MGCKCILWDQNIFARKIFNLNMRIGIDARLISETGVGRYIRNLLDSLQHVDSHNEYVVFLRKKNFDTFSIPNNRWKKVMAEVPWHTVREQFIMPKIFTNQHLDLVHVPYFNVPILYSGPMIITLHDLTILHFDTGKASTLPWLLYQIRRLGYRFVLWQGVHKAVKIIAVSHATKKEIIQHFRVPEDKIIVTYEGIDQNFEGQKARNIKNEKIISGQYLLYVGNAYPHKNLNILLAAFKEYVKSNLYSERRMKLILVGKDDFFYRRLKKAVAELELDNGIVFFGSASDVQLLNLYRNAYALVFPSLMEGFGLPAIEALAVGCPVICSDIPVFHEILGNNATYFDPHNPVDICQKLVSPIGRKRVLPAAKYNWDKMTKSTQEAYEGSNRI